MQRCTNGLSRCVGQRVAYTVLLLCVMLLVSVAPVTAHNFADDFILLESSNWEIQGSPQVDGVLTLANTGAVEGIRSVPLFTPGHSLDFDATFTACTSQNVGFANDAFNKYLLISTWNGGNLSVAVEDGSGVDLVEIYAVVPDVSHHFAIEWRITDQAYVYVDNTLVYQSSIDFISSMDVVAYSNCQNNAYPVIVDNIVVVDGLFITPTPTGEILVTPTPTPLPENVVTEQQLQAMTYEEIRRLRILLLILGPIVAIVGIFAWFRVRQ